MDIINKEVSFNINSLKLVFFITIIYSFFFMGALPSNNNSYFLSFIFIALPSIICYCLTNPLKEINYSFSFKIIDVLFILSIWFLLNLINLTNTDLQSDEVWYSFKSNLFSYVIYEKLINAFNIVKSWNHFLVLRIISLLLITFSFLIVFKNRRFFNNLGFYLIILIVLRALLLILSPDNGIPFIHPPLSSFIGLIFTIIFGISEMNFKISQSIPLLIILFFVIKKLKFSQTKQFLFFSIIVLIPLIGYYNLIVEQSIYFVIFFTLVFFSSDNLKIRDLSYVIGISILFRQTCVILIFIPFLASLFRKRFNYKDFIPLLIGFPIFFKSLIYGTPSTDKLGNLNLNDSFNIINYFEITYDSLKIFVVLLIIYLMYLLFKKKYFNFLIIMVILFSYPIIHKTTNMPFEGKYIYEYFGSFIFIIIIEFTRLLSLYTYSLFISLLITYNNFIHPISNLSKILLSKNIEINERLEKYAGKMFYIKKNNRKKIFDYLGNNTSKSIFIHYDPKKFSLFLNSKSLNDLNTKFKAHVMYLDMLGSEILFTTLSSKIINKLINDIEYVVLTQKSVINENKNEINKLLSSGWEIYSENIENKTNYKTLILRKNIN